MKISRQCWLVGHKSFGIDTDGGFDNIESFGEEEAREWGLLPYPDVNETGYFICSCGSHEYYDDWNYGIIPHISSFFYGIGFYLSSIKYKFYTKCYDCNRFRTILGRHVGEHKDCLPF